MTHLKFDYYNGNQVLLYSLLHVNVVLHVRSEDEHVDTYTYMFRWYIQIYIHIYIHILICIYYIYTYRYRYIHTSEYSFNILVFTVGGSQQVFREIKFSDKKFKKVRSVTYPVFEGSWEEEGAFFFWCVWQILRESMYPSLLRVVYYETMKRKLI